MDDLAKPLSFSSLTASAIVIVGNFYFIYPRQIIPHYKPDHTWIKGEKTRAKSSAPG